jgi:putative intracellular protease/amidase
MKSKVLVLVAPGFEEADVSTVTRTLRRSGLSVAVVGLTAGPVRGAYGLSLVPDLTLSEVDIERPRAVVLPGGVQGSRRFNADPRVHLLLRQVAGQGGYVLAIDTAYTVLCSAGALGRGEAGPGNGAGEETGEGPALGWRGEAVVSERVSVKGPVIFGQDSGAAQEAALALASLLES